MSEEKIAAAIKKTYIKLQEDHQEIFDRVEMYNQMYRGEFQPDETWEWEYDLVDPISFYLIRNLMSRLNPEGFRVRLEPRTEKDYALRDINQQIINWELQEINRVLVLYNFIYRGLIAGRAYLKTGWLFNKAIEIRENGKLRYSKSKVNRAYAKNIRFQDIFIPNRNIPTIEDQPFIIERVSMRFGDMLDDNEATGGKVWKPDYLKQIKEKKMFSNKVSYGFDIKSTDEMTEDLYFRNQYVDLLLMYTKDGDKYYTLTKEKDWILNIDTKNEFWHNHYPYISWAPFPEDDEFFSMGAIQPIEDLQKALTSTLNQYLTNIRKTTNPMWIAGSQAAQTPDFMFVNRPDGIIRVQGDPNQVIPVRTPDVSESLIMMRRELSTIFEKTAGTPSFYMAGAAFGSTPQLNKTATGAKIIDANVETNFQMLITLLGSQAIAKLGEHFLELNAQYITEEQEIRITDREGVRFLKVKPEEISANFDVIANADTMTKDSPVVKQAQLLNLKATMDAEKEVKFNKKELWKSIISAFPEVANIDNLIIDPEQQAKDVINSINNGIFPDIPINMDHKAVHKLIQVYLLSQEGNPDFPDEIRQMFIKYLDDLQKYIDAEKKIYTNEQPLLPTQPEEILDQTQEPQTPTMPTNEVDLMKKLTSKNQLITNPTESLPFKLKEEQIYGY